MEEPPSPNQLSQLEGAIKFILHKAVQGVLRNTRLLALAPLVACGPPPYKGDVVLCTYQKNTTEMPSNLFFDEDEFYFGLSVNESAGFVELQTSTPYTIEIDVSSLKEEIAASQDFEIPDEISSSGGELDIIKIKERFRWTKMKTGYTHSGKTVKFKVKYTPPSEGITEEEEWGLVEISGNRLDGRFKAEVLIVTRPQFEETEKKLARFCRRELGELEDPEGLIAM